MPKTTLTLTDDRTRIVLRTPYSAAFLEFVYRLPNPRWNAREKEWTCDFTPATAWRIEQHFDGQAEVDRTIIAAGSEFIAGTQGAAGVRGQVPICQPSVRKTEAWSHQSTAYLFGLHQHEATMLAMDMGTGKSKVTIDLLVNWGARRVLILCPVSVLQVWPREFRMHGPDNARLLVLDKGGTRQKAERASQFLRGYGLSSNEMGVVVVNYESAWREAFAEWSLTQSWDCVVCDESHRIKSHGSKVSKYCARLARVGTRRLALTGTPMNTPLDLFGQFRFLDAGIFGTSFVRFRNHYAVCANPCIPQQVTAYRNQDELQENFRLLAYQVSADVLDLPSVQHHDRTFELSPFARQIYKCLEEELIADIGSGVVTASNALVRLLRLQQATSGYAVREEDDQEVPIDSGKADLLADLLADLDEREPVVVFCRFRHDLAAVRLIAERAGRRWGELSGSRNDLIDGKLPGTIDLLGVQIRAGGVGVDLSRAHYCVYFSKGFSLLEYQQSLARVHRPGQVHPVHYYHLLAANTVDEYLQKVLAKRRDAVKGILETYRKDERCKLTSTATTGGRSG
jgi:SNF2 family DNA or RNA helicase